MSKWIKTDLSSKDLIQSHYLTHTVPFTVSLSAAALSLHPLGHPVTAAVLRETIKGTSA
jgi:hypothetical protein